MESRLESRISSGQRASTSTSMLAKRQLRCRVYKETSSEGGFPCRTPKASATGQDWRAFRAHLVAWEHSTRRAAQPKVHLQRPPYPPLVSGDSWAHPLAEPERGCLLLARHDDMKFFSGAVVLITSHDAAAGSLGYVLNKPSPLRVEDLQVLSAASGFQEAFRGARLHLGGPAHLDHVTLLHRFAGLSRSHNVTVGIFMGGLPDAIRLVQAGLARPADFHLALGMSCWAAGQLQAEVAAGHWHVISASPDLVLPPASPPPVTCSRSDCNAAPPHTAAAASPHPGSSPRSASAPQQPAGSRSAGTSAAAAAAAAASTHMHGSTASSGSCRPRGHQQQTHGHREAGADGCGVAEAQEELEEGAEGCTVWRQQQQESGRLQMYKRIARLAVRGA